MTAIDERGDGAFDVSIDFAAATVGADAGQLVNMLFGKHVLHDDVMLSSVAFPRELLSAFGGPSHGVSGTSRAR